MESAGRTALWQACRAIGPDVKSIGGYLGSAINRAFKRRAKKEHKESLGAINLDPFDPPDTFAENNAPVEELWHEVMAGCDDIDRQILWRLVDKQSQSAIAKALGITRKAVAKRIEAIRQRHTKAH